MNDASLPKAVGGQSLARSSLRWLTGAWWLAVLSSLAWLVVSGIVFRFASTAAAILLLAAVFVLSAADEFLVRARRGSPAQRDLPAQRGLAARRRLTGHALAAELALVLTLVLASLHGHLSSADEVLCLLLPVIAVAVAGGLIPAVIEAVTGSLLFRFLVMPQPGKPVMAGAVGVAILGVLVGLAVVVSLLAEGASRYIRQAARATAVIRELRPSLASADEAVNRLRRPGIQLTAEHHDQLLATVEESLGRLSRVATGLLDVSRE